MLVVHGSNQVEHAITHYTTALTLCMKLGEKHKCGDHGSSRCFSWSLNLSFVAGAGRRHSRHYCPHNIIPRSVRTSTSNNIYEAQGQLPLEDGDTNVTLPVFPSLLSICSRHPVATSSRRASATENAHTYAWRDSWVCSRARCDSSRVLVVAEVLSPTAQG